MSKPQVERPYLWHIFSDLERFYNTHELAESFRNFFARHSDIKKWFISSDYCIGDKDKANNTMCISIIPYTKYFPDMKSEIAKLAPKDIKKSKSVNDNFVKYLADGNSFHLCFLITDFSGLGDTREDIGQMADSLVEMYKGWLSTTPEAAASYQAIIKKLKFLKQETMGKGFNIDLFRNMYFLVFMVSYYLYCIKKWTRADTAGWFSDRDSMISGFKGLAFDLLGMHFHSLCEAGKIASDGFDMAIGVPESAGKMWYDELVRIPDYIAGAFADFDMSTNVCKDKFLPLVEDFGTVDDAFLLMKIGFHKTIFEHKVITLTPDS